MTKNSDEMAFQEWLGSSSASSDEIKKFQAMTEHERIRHCMSLAWQARGEYERKRSEKLFEALKYYADYMNYSLDDYCGISGEMRSRVILYGDSEEINDVTSHAGRRARQALQEYQARDR